MIVLYVRPNSDRQLKVSMCAVLYFIYILQDAYRRYEIALYVFLINPQTIVTCAWYAIRIVILCGEERL